MFVVPGDNVVTKPPGTGVDTTAGFVELQVHDAVKSCVLVVPGNVAVAANWYVVETAMNGLAGVTEMVTGVAMVYVVELEMWFIVSVAVMVAVPNDEDNVARPVASINVIGSE